MVFLVDVVSEAENWISNNVLFKLFQIIVELLLYLVFSLFPIYFAAILLKKNAMTKKRAQRILIVFVVYVIFLAIAYASFGAQLAFYALLVLGIAWNILNAFDETLLLNTRATIRALATTYPFITKITNILSPKSDLGSVDREEIKHSEVRARLGLPPNVTALKCSYCNQEIVLDSERFGVVVDGKFFCNSLKCMDDANKTLIR